MGFFFYKFDIAIEKARVWLPFRAVLLKRFTKKGLNNNKHWSAALGSIGASHFVS